MILNPLRHQSIRVLAAAAMLLMAAAGPLAAGPGARDNGSITGHVTTGALAPIANVTVQIMDATGSQVASPVTDAGGAFLAGNLAPGTYYARTSNALGYVDQLYDAITVRPWEWSRGAPITVTSAGVTDIVFRLAPGGQIGGRFTGATSGVPIASGVGLEIFDASGQMVNGSGGVDVNGYYLSPALPPGTYYVRSNNQLGYINQLYNNAPSWANVTTGQPVVVSAGATTPNIDFALAAGGRISGRFTDSGSGLPLTSNVWVDIIDTNGTFLGSSNWPDASGNYISSFGLPPGTYYARSNSNDTHINEVYNNLPAWTPITSGTPIVVAGTATTTGIDFALDAGGRIAGRITDAANGNGLSVGVTAYDPSGRWMAGIGTDPAGYYTLSGLPAGNYHVITNNSLGYINQAYNNVVCLNCAATTGTTVAVTVGATTGGINFALNAGGRIAGRLTDAGTGLAISGNDIWVNVHDATGRHLGGASPDASGNYSTSFGLPSGTYYAGTDNRRRYINQVYNGLSGPRNVTSGTPITVVAGVATNGIDFALAAGGAISGRATAASSGTPLSGLGVSFFDASGAYAGGMSTDASGNYVSTGLSAGTYYVRTDPFGAYIQTAYLNQICLGCAITTTTPVIVSQGQTTGGIDFALVVGGQISGRMTNAADGTGAPGVSVEICSPTGNCFGRVTPPDSTGNYITFGLPAGTYFVRTNGSHFFVNKLYNDLPFGTNVTSGTPVPVTLGAVTGGINFSLSAGGRVSGRVTDAGTGLPVSNGSVSIFNTANQWQGSSGLNANGEYTSPTVPTGTYYLQTDNVVPYIRQVYNNIQCPNCNPTQAGTGVAVMNGQVTPNIDFALVRGGQIAGRIADNLGAAIPGAWVTVFNSSGNGLGWSTNADATGAYTAYGLPTGSYYVRTNTNGSYVDKLYNNITCLSCSVTTGTPVAATQGLATSGIDFALDPGGTITGTVSYAAGGAPIAFTNVRVFNTTNANVKTVTTNASGVYTATGLPSGTYYVRSSNPLGLVDILYNNIPCTGGACTATTGTGVAVNAPQTVSGINLALPAGGSIGGTVTAAVGGAPIASATVRIYTTSNAQVASVTTNASGVYTAGGLATGTYYARTANTPAYVGQLYNNISCPTENCTANTGTGIAVTQGVTTGGINFSLAAAGSVTGTVSAAANGAKLANAIVRAFNSSNAQIGNGTTDASGVYTVVGLPPGQVYVRTQNGLGYIDMLYNGLPCPLGNCTTNTGTAVNVTAGAPTTGIDFALALGGTVSGTITDAGTSAPVAGLSVRVFDASNNQLGNTNTSPSGAYAFTGVAGGTYYVKTGTAAGMGYIDQLYSGLTCPGGTCAATLGTPVSVTVGATSTVNFALSRGGTISGTVTGNAAPLSGVSVQILDANGQPVWSTNTTPSGTYSVSGLPTGSYYAQTTSGPAQGFANQIYNGLTCYGCPVVSGTPIVVTAGQTMAGIDFALTQGATITGAVTAGGNPVNGIEIDLYSTGSRFLLSRTTDTAGGFGFNGLPPGTYFVQTAASPSGYLEQTYNGVNCGGVGCDTSAGTSVTVAAGQTLSGINFSLSRGGAISGTVTNGTAPVAGVTVTAVTRSGFGTYPGVVTDAQGMYTINGLPAGLYVVRATGVAADGYVTELYNGLSCASCTYLSGTSVPVTQGQTTPGINFILAHGVSLSGHVTDGINPVANVTVTVYGASGYTIAGSTTNASGVYSVAGLTPGTYYARTTNAAGPGFVEQLYSGKPCPGGACVIPLGNGIQVTAQGASNVDFALTPGGRITGLVTTGGVPARNATVRVFNAAGVQVAAPKTNGSGYYFINGLPAGTYFARASNSGFGDIVYNGVACPGASCKVTDGTPITVTAGGSTVANFNFTRAGATISGTVTGGGSPLSEVTVTLFASNGATVTTAWTGGAGTYSFAGLPGGTYYLTTYNQAGFVDQIFGGPICIMGYCDPTTGTAVVVSEGGSSTNVDFPLVAGATITGTIRNTSGAPVPDVLPFVITTHGDSTAYGWSDISGAYSIRGLAADTYYVVTSRAPNVGYMNQRYDGVSHLYGDATAGTPVPLAAGVVRGGVDFTLAAGGTVSGTVTDAATSAPLGEVIVRLADSTGRRLLVATTGPDGLYVLRGLPTGNYYVYTDNMLGYQNQASSGVVCPFWPCLASASTVAVTAGATTGNVNFALQPGSRVEGRVVDATSQAGVGGIEVFILDPSGGVVGNARSDATGRYVSNQAVTPGTYYARTNPISGFAMQQYSGKACPGGTCQATSGDAITVPSGSRATGVDFSLARCGTLAVGPAALGNPTLGVPYSATIAASGGAQPYGFSAAEVDGWGPGTPNPGSVTTNGFRVARGTMPPGLSLDPTTGALTGTVTQLGSYWFVVGAVDSQGCSASRFYVVAVDTAPNTITWPNPSSIAYGTPIGPTQLNATAGIPGTFTYTPASGTVLPPGTSSLSVVFTPTDTVNYRAAAKSVPIVVTAGATPTITVTWPNGGENLLLTSRVAIRWSSTGYVANVRIEVSTNGGTSWSNIVSSTPNTGTFETYVGGAPGTQYLLRISDVSNPAVFDVCDAAFTVIGDTTEPNDSSATAAVLPMGTTATLLFESETAIDWYKFYVPPASAGQDLRVNVRVLSDYPTPRPAGWRSDIDFEVLDGSLRPLTVAISGSDNETLYLHNVASGWYYINVGYSTTDYADGTGMAHYAVTLETGTGFGLGYVSGRVADGSGQGIGGVSVRMQPLPLDWNVSFPIGLTNPDGTFSIARAPGSYNLFFTGRDQYNSTTWTINVVDEYYHDRTLAADADAVSLPAGVTLNLGTITMDVGAIVSGRVTNLSGGPLNAATIQSYDLGGNAFSFVRTDAAGNYTLQGVPVGGAVLRAAKSVYATEFYQDKPSVGTATTLPTQSGVTLSGIDFQLGSGGTISGNVRDLRGFGISASVKLYSVLDGTFPRSWITSAAGTGAFSMTGILPGEYALYFGTPNTAYLPEWYSASATFAAATHLLVTAGGAVSGIVGQLADAVPVITLAQAGTPLASGGTHPIGSRTVNTDTDVVFMIGNTGVGGLILTGLPLSTTGANADQFAVVAQPVSPVAEAGTTTFTVRFRPTSVGAKSAQIAIANSDADRTPYILNLTGTGVAAPSSVTVASIGPSNGSTLGGTAVAIAGTGFVNGATVTIGGVAATSVTVVNAASITATTGPHAEGPVAVVVTNPDSQSGTLPNGFTYTAPSARVVRIVSMTGMVGTTVNLPVELVSQGDENAVGFTLTFDPAVLGYPSPNPTPAVTLGTCAAGASVNVNATQAASGRLGIVLALSAGQTFAAGTCRMLTVPLIVAAGAGSTATAVGFGDDPVAREVSGALANVLGASWAPGTVTPTRGYEGDVAPRPSGSGTLTVTDWVQAGRFVAGLDTAAAGSEYQRADTAPRATSGDGRLTATDWVQAGRYVAGLDPQTPAGGPTAAAGQAASARPTPEAARPREGAGPTVIAVPAMAAGWGRSAVVPVMLQAQGIENAVGFSVTFDPTRLTFISAALGSNVATATSNVNALAAGSGRVGIALALSSGLSMPAGAYPLVLLTFQAAAGSGTATTAIGFGDDPIVREVSDTVANVVATTYQGASITLGPLPTFTDDPLQPRVTPVKTGHVTELRQQIDVLRARFGLSTFVWTDATLTAGTTLVKAAHLTELRAALAAVYTAAGRTPPTWSATTITARTTVITAAQIAEVRTALLAIW
ncbi:MAG TPA: carboxypeptidase regulatory-like domain-containing protein [Vicinamibacterales bacterium]|jgi:hypothetical protein